MVTKNGLMISSRKPSLSKYRLSPISPYSRDHQSYLSQSDDKCQDHETTATVSYETGWHRLLNLSDLRIHLKVMEFRLILPPASTHAKVDRAPFTSSNPNYRHKKINNWVSIRVSLD